MKYLASLLTLLVLAVGCSDTTPTQEKTDTPEDLVPEYLILKSSASGNTIESSLNLASEEPVLSDPESDIRTYTFNELDDYPPLNYLDNPYHELKFESSTYFYVTKRVRGYRAGNLIIPITEDLSKGLDERMIKLPNPASQVELTAIWYNGADRPQLRAYAEDGTLMDVDTVKTSTYVQNHLVVQHGDQPIASIGLYAHNWGVYYDNLILHEITNQTPLAKFDLAKTVEATGPQGASITLDGSLSSDPDGDALSYAWYMDGQMILSVASGESSLPLGAHQIKLEVSDPSGAANSAAQEMEVVDTTPPKIMSSNLDTEIWPPNNKLRRVAVYQATDLVSEPTLDVTVTSDSRKFSQRDWRIEQTSNSNVSVWVRARKDGRTGRNYYIQTTATDQAGNTAETSLTVTVPHDQGH